MRTSTLAYIYPNPQQPEKSCLTDLHEASPFSTPIRESPDFDSEFGAAKLSPDLHEDYCNSVGELRYLSYSTSLDITFNLIASQVYKPTNIQKYAPN